MFVCCVCCVLSGRGPCDELITRPEESYRLWRVVVGDQETSCYEEAIACAGLQSQRNKKTRRGWAINATPRLLYPREREWVPNGQEAEWALGPVRKFSPPTGVRTPIYPASNESLYKLPTLTRSNKTINNLYVDKQFICRRRGRRHLWQSLTNWRTTLWNNRDGSICVFTILTSWGSIMANIL
jgi:hypothetical protein